MAEFPAMPWWTDAYLADTTHLTTLEHGAYMLLLAAMWRSGEARLPADDERLARIVKLGPKQWQRIRATIMEFLKEENGYLVQRRLKDEWVAVKQRSQKATESANAKWLKHKKGRHANASAEQCERNATITTTITNIDIVQNLDPDFTDFYSAYPKKQSKRTAEKAYKQARKLGASHETIMAGLDRAKRADSRFRELKFTPLPASWLNAGGFMDETNEMRNWKEAIL